MVDAESTSAPSEPSFGDALIHLLESGQRLVLDRIDLARFDLRQLAGRALRGATLAVMGGVLLAGAWFMAMGSAVIWLEPYVPLAASLGIAAGLSGVVGASAIGIGIRRAGSANELGAAGSQLTGSSGPERSAAAFSGSESPR